MRAKKLSVNVRKDNIIFGWPKRACIAGQNEPESWYGEQLDLVIYPIGEGEKMDLSRQFILINRWDCKLPSHGLQAGNDTLEIPPGETFIPVVLLLDSGGNQILFDEFEPSGGRNGYMDVVSPHMLCIVTRTNNLKGI